MKRTSSVRPEKTEKEIISQEEPLEVVVEGGGEGKEAYMHEKHTG
jgi:hypothetical protein